MDSLSAPQLLILCVILVLGGLIVFYAIHFMKANGKTAPKVFKWKNLQLAPGQTALLEKKHPIKAISTRRYYPGIQRIELLINGVTMEETPFELSC